MAAFSLSSLIFALLTFSLLPLSFCDQCSSLTFPNRIYSTCNDLPTLGASLHYTYSSATSDLDIAFVATPASPNGWVSWALNPTGTGMAGSQTLIAYKDANGKMVVKTFNITAYGPVTEGPISYPVSGLAAEYADGKMKIFGKLVLGKGVKKVNQVWQVGASAVNGVVMKHAFAPENLMAKGSLDLVKGISSGGDGAYGFKEKNVHGILNAVSWGILLPIGAIFARYLKTFKSADPAWFYLHVSCQIIGYALGVAGWSTGLNLGNRSKGITYTTHRNIGITLFSLGTLQVFALLLRPNKDHKYRLYWNIYHHSVGYTVIILGVINVFKGLQILSPEHKWKEAYIVVISLLGAIAVLLEVVTWIIVLKRRSKKSSKLSAGANGP